MNTHPEVVGNARYSLPPQSVGDVYCSPWCGLGCKRAWYDHAVTRAAALAARLGDGWEPVVWENLGWHWRAERGVASIYPIEDRNARFPYPVVSYTANINTAKQFIANAETPEAALGFATQNARGAERKIAADLAALQA